MSAKGKSVNQKRGANSKTEGQYLNVKLPKSARHTLAPLIVTIVVVILELFVAFFGMIQDSAHGADTQGELKSTKGVLSAATVQFHLTWGLMLSVTLSFVENSLTWTMNRQKCNLFGGINVLLCLGFFLTSIYTWLWANDAAGMVMICKYILVSVNVRMSPDQIKALAYNDQIKLGIDLCVSWLLPAQCLFVLIDCVISQCACDGVRDELPLVFQTTVKTVTKNGRQQVVDQNGRSTTGTCDTYIQENTFQCRIDWNKFSQRIDTK